MDKFPILGRDSYACGPAPESGRGGTAGAGSSGWVKGVGWWATHLTRFSHSLWTLCVIVSMWFTMFRKPLRFGAFTVSCLWPGQSEQCHDTGVSVPSAEDAAANVPRKVRCGSFFCSF